MANAEKSALLQGIMQHQYNPAGIQREVLAELERATSGAIQVVDPTNPFVFVLESAAVQTAAFMIQNDANTRKQYPFSAQTEDELYLHMSDKDYVDRFATPAAAKFALIMPVDELVARMVVDPDTTYKKLVIPRNTFFTVADVKFSIQYPIEIRLLAHGGLVVVYDVEKPSPLQQLSTNLIQHEIRPIGGSEWLYFEVDTLQFSIVSQKDTLNAAKDFKHSMTLDDQYYYTRVYVQNAANEWEEIRTTHSDQVYDINVPTAVLRVVGKKLTVTIPQIYTSTRLLNKGIRIDAYQTKGPLNMLLYEYPMGSVTATFAAYDKADETVFTAPLKAMRSVVPTSDSVVAGGADALTFAALRERVLKNAAGAQELPITNVQIEQALDRKGYAVVKNVDNITNRVFLATRSMPSPKDTSLLTAAAASIETVSFKTQDAVQLSTVIDNGTQITLLPETVYKNVNGITSLVSSAEVTSIMALPAEKQAIAISANNYLFTPFHYVLDMDDNEFACRPYYLDKPQIETKLFVAENDTTLLQVNTGLYMIERTETGYRIWLTTRSDGALKQLASNEVHAQLAYIPVGEKQRAYINGNLVNVSDKGERTFTFDLSTDFHIDKSHNLKLTKFSMYSDELVSSFTPLLCEFDVLYSTSAVLGGQWRPNAVDQALGEFLLPSRIAGISHEKLRVRFGYALTTLWARARSVISTVAYQKWDVDVPRFYDHDVYQRDSSGAAVVIDDAGVPTFNKLHAAGDPVLDEEGQITYRWRKGDVKMDPATGLPVVANPRGMLRQVDLMVIEGAYRFATDSTTVAYRALLTATLVDWLTNELSTMTAKLLDQTRLYFYPKTTLGTVEVMVTNGQVKSISAGQAFRVALHVSATVFANAELRERLVKTTVAAISAALQSSTVSIDAMSTLLRSSYGNDVIAAQVTGLGGSEAFQAVTLLNEEDRLSIRKRLTAQADNTLVVEEDVTVEFIRHERLV